MNTGRRYPANDRVRQLWNRQHLGTALTTTKAGKVERVHLVLSGNEFCQRNHVKAGNDQPVNEDERDVIASGWPAASAVERASLHGRETALQPGARRKPEITKQFRKHAEGETQLALVDCIPRLSGWTLLA